MKKNIFVFALLTVIILTSCETANESIDTSNISYSYGLYSINGEKIVEDNFWNLNGDNSVTYELYESTTIVPKTKNISFGFIWTVSTDTSTTISDCKVQVYRGNSSNFDEMSLITDDRSKRKTNTKNEAIITLDNQNDLNYKYYNICVIIDSTKVINELFNISE